MSTWTITCEYEELHAVWRVFSRSLEIETATAGIWVRSVDGHRVWSGQCGPLWWEVNGGATAERVEPRCLPARLVWNAADLAFETDERIVTISTPDDSVGIAATAEGQTIIDLPAPEEGHRTFPRYVLDRATATLRRRELSLLLGRIWFVPYGAEDLRNVPVRLLVEDGQLTAFIDWRIKGGLRTTQRVKAATTGSANGGIPVLHLLDLLREIDDDTEITLRFPESVEFPLMIEADGWRATCEIWSESVHRFEIDVVEALTKATGQPARNLGCGVIVGAIGDRRLRTELQEDHGELLRVTTVVVEDIEPNIDVFTQINELNSSLVGGRIWVDADAVVAGVEVPCDDLDALGPELERLDRQLQGVDVYLSAIASAAD